MMNQSHYDVVVADAEMSEMSAPELLSVAIADDPEAASRFVFVAAEFSLETESVCQERGITRLQKPFGLGQLWDAVHDTVAKSTEAQPRH